MQPVALFRGIAEHVGGLADVVLLKPCLGESAADLEGLVTREARLFQGANEHRRGVTTWQKQLWNLLMLEYWHRTFVDERPRAASPLEYAAVAAKPEAFSTAN